MFQEKVFEKAKLFEKQVIILLFHLYTAKARKNMKSDIGGEIILLHSQYQNVQNNKQTKIIGLHHRKLLLINSRSLYQQ